MQQHDIVSQTRNRWHAILSDEGLSKLALSGKHGPCPICGGKDRFRFDNLEGKGSWICNQCGAGDGFQLVMRMTGLDFRAVADRIRHRLGVKGADFDPAPKPEVTYEQRKESMRKLWRMSRPVVPGDLVDGYLRSRNLGLHAYSPDLRFCPECPVTGAGDKKVLPAMLAIVRDHDANIVSMHRTYLDGPVKAKIEAPRRLMAGPPLSKGCAVMLDAPTPGGDLGIAEGIETAMGAARYFDMPVWSVLNTSIMRDFNPPPGVKEVSIFADNDAHFAGQAAAYLLANRLKLSGYDVIVRIPQNTGDDWADVWGRMANA